jgi:hypothetical protein
MSTLDNKLDTSVITKFDIPLSEAAEDLYLFEVAAIERHYQKGLDAMSALEMGAGVIWAHARRRSSSVSWDLVSWLRVKDLGELFVDEAEVEDEVAESLGTGGAGPKEG